MKFEIYTASICFLGWVLHWLSSWGEAWKKHHQTLLDYVDDNPPAFYTSVVGTLAIYLIGPSIAPAVGLTLPVAFDDPAVKGVIAFLAGYGADSLVYKIATFLPKKES